MEIGLLDDKSPSCWSKHRCTIIVALCILILVVLVIVLIVELKKSDSDEDKDEAFTILKKDSDFIKPNIRLDAEFQLIKTKNGMIGLLINDPYADYSQVTLSIPNGSYTETVPGLAHFGEHMVSGGSKRYPNIYPVYNPIIGGVWKAIDNAATGGTMQMYYMAVPYDFLFEESIDLLMDSFKYPLYNSDVVKKEIQPVNSEFYLGINSFSSLSEAIIQQSSSIKTSFHGMACGNNETLNPEESEILAKKLRGYHMEIKKPENIFFSLYSNTTMKNLEKYSNDYFTYKMHQYRDDEIDVEDRKKLIENGETITKYDIFDENLYKHGFYFISDKKRNLLLLYFNLGNVNYFDLQFDIIEYIKYLFNSQSLKKILLNDILVREFTDIENNHVLNLIYEIHDIELVGEIEDILLIIYKYIEIIKEHGYEKKYFVNFIKYKKNKQILDFKKQNFEQIFDNFLEKVVKNYRMYGVNQIFTDGTPSEEDYDENKLKNILNQIQYERSFFGVNVMIDDLEEFKDITFLESPKIKVLQYYNKNYVFGKIPNEFQNKITNSAYNIEDLNIREINEYFSEKTESVIPCYKEKTNKCKEKNEYDFKNEDEYKGTKLSEEKEGYETMYQIDKSSESYIVNSYISFVLKNEKDVSFLKTYFELKLSEIDELDAFQIFAEDNYIGIQLKSFSDNTEKLLDAMIKLIKIGPTNNDIDLLEIMTKSNIIEKVLEKSLDGYTINLYKDFMKGSKTEDDDIDSIMEIISSDLEELSHYEELFLKNIGLIQFKIAGNIDENLVKNIHNKIKDNFEINTLDEPILKQPQLKEEENPYIINYYQKSEIHEEVDNSILVKYYYEKKYQKLLIVFTACMELIGAPLLRFNYSNSYTPQIFLDQEYFNILERGKYKEVDGMEDDINNVIYGVINGNIDCPNYDNILKSYSLKGSGKIEKTPDNLFELFKYDVEFRKLKAEEEEEFLKVPDTWKKLIEMISPIFKNPKRFTFLVVRPEGSDDDTFTKLIEKRKKNLKYKLNESINIEHTSEIDYWVTRQK